MLFSLIYLFLACTAYSALPSTVHSSTTPRRGVTGEYCKRSEHCEGGRVCVQQERALEHILCKESDECICFPYSPQSCVSSNDCEAREVCAFVPGVKGPLCASAVIVAYTPELVEQQGEEPRPQVSDSSGLSFYPCKRGSTCKGGRQCLFRDGSNSPQVCQLGMTCACDPIIPQLCNTSAHCVQGEVCAYADAIGLCMAADVVAAIGFFTSTESIPGVATPSPEASQTTAHTVVASVTHRPTRSPKALYPSSNLTATVDPSFTAQQSLAPSNTVLTPSAQLSATQENTVPTPSSHPSQTEIPSSLPSASNTPSPNTVSTSPQTSTSQTPAPSESLSANVTESITPSPSASAISSATGVCIDAKALAHFTAEELVFPKHRFARVLCDESGSCATPGHIVVWKGSAMMMRQYCDTVKSCLEDRMFVNSPRFRARFRLESRTERLEYTAFAARYETLVEESFLRALVHYGL